MLYEPSTILEHYRNHCWGQMATSTCCQLVHCDCHASLLPPPPHTHTHSRVGPAPLRPPPTHSGPNDSDLLRVSPCQGYVAGRVGLTGGV